jgi:glycosyltransferase involved in cell wall biosynthesis
VLEGYFSPSVSAIFTAIERLLARCTTCLIAVSEEVRNDLVRLRVAAPERIVVVPLGFDFSRFEESKEERRERRERFRTSLGIPLDVQLVTLVARLEPIKRVDRFLRVASLIEQPDTRFLIVGDGALREELRCSSEATSLGGRLVWAGLRDDMPDVYFATDVLAVTSDNEGTNVSAIEAHAARLPVVTTRVGGMPSVVRDGQSGFVVQRDDERAFANAISRLLLNDELRDQFGVAGREAMRAKFSQDRLIDDVDELYRQLLDNTVGTEAEAAA